jgi:hypothetical protein
MPPPKPLVIDAPEEVCRFREAPAESAVVRDSSFFPDARQRSLPTDLKGEIQRFQHADYANQFFREPRGGKAFAWKKVSVEAMSQFQSEPLKEPLLTQHTKTSSKAAIDCFKLILTYTGADPTSKTKPGMAILVSRLISNLVSIPELRDEVYFQLIKQTRDNGNRDCLKLTWDLFLIVATMIPASRNSETWIKAHLYNSSQDVRIPEISDMAQFTYIRFNTRCLIGKPLLDNALPIIHRTPGEVADSHRAFGASIYEQLWNQRRRFPRAPIPIVIHEMAEALIEKGIEQWEGAFRLVGNMQKVKTMQTSVNDGGSPFGTAEINDLASLFKSWFSSLPEPIVDQENLPDLKTAFETKTFIEFASRLTPAHAATLKYLVGFLKRLVPNEAVTRMGAKNYAICFAPNIFDTDSIREHSQAQQFVDMSIECLVNLIEFWDTRELYPLKPIYLQTR